MANINNDQRKHLAGLIESNNDATEINEQLERAEVARRLIKHTLLVKEYVKSANELAKARLVVSKIDAEKGKAESALERASHVEIGYDGTAELSWKTKQNLRAKTENPKQYLKRVWASQDIETATKVVDEYLAQFKREVKVDEKGEALILALATAKEADAE